MKMIAKFPIYTRNHCTVKKNKSIELHNVGLCVNPSLHHILVHPLTEVFLTHQAMIFMAVLRSRPGPSHGWFETKSQPLLLNSRSTSISCTTTGWFWCLYSGIGDVHKERIYNDQDIWESIMLYENKIVFMQSIIARA